MRWLPLLLLAACAGRARPAPLPPSTADWSLDPVEDCARWDDRGLQRHLDRVTDSRARSGNAARLLVNGAEAWEARLENLRTADVILVKTFIWADDHSSRDLARRLEDRARAGALVVVQYDLKGSLRGLGDLARSLDLRAGEDWLRDLPHVARMRAAGVTVVPTNVPRSKRQRRRWAASVEEAQRLVAAGPHRGDVGRLRGLNHFDHEKYFLTAHRDAQNRLVWRAILGGLNVADEYAWGGTGRRPHAEARAGWRDTDLEVRGPVTTDIVRRYLRVLAVNVDDADLPDDPRLRRDLLLQPQPRAGAARARFVWNQPALRNPRRIERLLRSLVRHTPEEAVIRLEMAYFAPSRRLRRPLQRALQQGRRVAVLTNSADSVDVPVVVDASRAAFADLLDAHPNAALFEWRPDRPAGLETLHVKAASFGACGPVVVGSANLDGLSSEHNSESVVMVDDPGLRRAFDAAFADDVSDPRAARITDQTLNQTPAVKRAWQRILYRVGWYFLGR